MDQKAIGSTLTEDMAISILCSLGLLCLVSVCSCVLCLSFCSYVLCLLQGGGGEEGDAKKSATEEADIPKPVFR